MPEPFNAYSEWLGVPPDIRWPNYYQLLGIQLYEADAKAIEEAADRHMAHLRTFQLGPRSAESQRLLKKVAGAKVCLLNPEKKAAYDARLRGAHNRPPVAPPLSPPIPASPVPSVAIATPQNPAPQNPIPGQISAPPPPANPTRAVTPSRLSGAGPIPVRLQATGQNQPVHVTESESEDDRRWTKKPMLLTALLIAVGVLGAGVIASWLGRGRVEKAVLVSAEAGREKPSDDLPDEVVAKPDPKQPTADFPTKTKEDGDQLPTPNNTTQPAGHTESMPGEKPAVGDEPKTASPQELIRQRRAMLLVEAACVIESTDKFLSALKKAGYGEAGIDYLELLENQGKLPIELTETLDLQKSACWHLAAKEAATPEEAAQRETTARQLLDSFLQEHANSSAVQETRLIASSFAFPLGLQLIAEGKNSTDNPAAESLMQEARKLLTESRAGLFKIATESKAEYKAKLRLFTKLTRGRPHITRRELHAAATETTLELLKKAKFSWLDSSVKLATAEYCKSQTYLDPKTANAKGSLRTCAKELDAMYQENRWSLAGQYAHLWTGKIEEELGNDDLALDIYDELSAGEPEGTELKETGREPLFAQVASFRLQSKFRKHGAGLFLEEAEAWLNQWEGAPDTLVKKAFRNTEGYQAIALQVVKGRLEMADKATGADKGRLNEAAKRRLTALIKAAMKSESQAEIIQLATAQGISNEVTPSPQAVAEAKASEEKNKSSSKLSPFSNLAGLDFKSITAADALNQPDLSDKKQGFASRGMSSRKTMLAGGGGTKQSERAVAAALNWLARHQSPAGNWSLEGFQQRCKGGQCSGQSQTKSDAAATALGVLPFLAAGQTQSSEGPYRVQIGSAIGWLIKHQKPDGLLATGSEHLMYTQGLATIALCEDYGLTKDAKVGSAAQAAIKYIERAQNRNTGGWRYQPGDEGDTSVLGWQVMALKSAQMAGLSVDASSFEGARRFLGTVKKSANGGLFSYVNLQEATPSMSALGLLCNQYLGAPRNDPSLNEGKVYLLTNSPDMQLRNIYYWYYATQTMHNLLGPEWDTWNRRMRKLLIETQVRNDCAVGSWDPALPTKDAWGEQGGRLMVTSLSCLTLEIYYRYLPLYQPDDVSPN